MNYKTLSLLPLLLFVSMASCALAESPVTPANCQIGVYDFPGEAVFPEGIAYDASRGVIYTGSAIDGTLFEVDLKTGEMTIIAAGGEEDRHAANGMKVDRQGRLWIAGGHTGKLFLYSPDDRKLLATISTSATEPAFINDVAIAPNDDVFFTDSFRSLIFKANSSMDGEIEPWLDYSDSVIPMIDGFNLNGIVVTEDGQYLLVVHTSKGGLFRIGTGDGEVAQVDLAGLSLVGGDGLLLNGNVLHVALNRSNQIVQIELSDNFLSGHLQGFVQGSFSFPTTIAKSDDTLFVVNSQINQQDSGATLPFTLHQVSLESHCIN